MSNDPFDLANFTLTPEQIAQLAPFQKQPKSKPQLSRSRRPAGTRFIQNSEVVKHLSTIKLMRENLQIRLLAGERVDPLDVVKIDECLKRYLPQGKPIEVNVQFVDSLPTPDTPSPTPPMPTPPTSPPPTTETSPAPSNVVPLRPAEDREAVLRATRPPLQTSQPWRSYVGPVGDPYGGSNPFSAPGPIPNFSSPYRGR
jgi:hypothetical protein